MSAMPLALLLTTAAATAVGAAALHTAHGLRRQVTALRDELAADDAAPGARSPLPRRAAATPTPPRYAPPWPRRSPRSASASSPRRAPSGPPRRPATPPTRPSLLGGLAGISEDVAFFCRARPTSRASRPWTRWSRSPESRRAAEPAEMPSCPSGGVPPRDSPELAAARRRHPSHPDFVPVQSPVVTDHERTVARLEELADARTALADVRPGPLGTLDVYVFADGTTLCMTPGHRETAERLAAALRAGETPVLLGGSGVSGAYALTFACGEENVYILADRVIASF